MATHDGLKLIAAGENQLSATGIQVIPRYLSTVLFLYFRVQDRQRPEDRMKFVALWNTVFFSLYFRKFLRALKHFKEKRQTGRDRQRHSDRQRETDKESQAER